MLEVYERAAQRLVNVEALSAGSKLADIADSKI